jgi:transposase
MHVCVHGMVPWTAMVIMRNLVHVEIALQNPLLERIGLLRRPRSRGLCRRCGHVGNGLGPVMARAGGSWRRASPGRGAAEARAKRKRGPRARGDGALGTRPKLLRPVESLVIGARSSSASRASHSLRAAKTHPTREWGHRRGAGALLVLDGVLVNRIRVCRQTATAKEGRSRRGSARKPERCDREPPALVVGGGGG